MSMRSATRRTLESLGLLQPAKRVLNPVRVTAANTAHVFNEALYRLPRPSHGQVAETPEQAALAGRLARELEDKGIVTLRGFLTGARLSEVQAAFSRMVSRVESSPSKGTKLSPPGYLPQTTYLEDECSREARIVCSNNPFKYAREFLAISTDPLILSVIAKYLRRSFYLQQAIASRYLPMEPADFGSFQWHHDGWGRKVNVMFLLTDVGDQDQYMTFIEGSHRTYHNLDRCRNSRFPEEEVERMFPGARRFRCTGSAGTAFIFDSNGMHRGNRSLGRHRDTLITSFNAGRYVWPFEVPVSFQTGLTDRQIEFLDNWSKVIWQAEP